MGGVSVTVDRKRRTMAAIAFAALSRLISVGPDFGGQDEDRYLGRGL